MNDKMMVSMAVPLSWEQYLHLNETWMPEGMNSVFLSRNWVEIDLDSIFSFERVRIVSEDEVSNSVM